MKRHIPYIIALTVVTGLILVAGNTAPAQTPDILEQAAFPIITVQPTDQAVTAGSNTVLSVQAIYADNYQWQSNGVDMVGQTNSTLILPNVGVNNAGFYSCNVSQSGGDPVPTRAASVLVETAANATVAGGVTADGVLGGGPIVVSGGPKASNGTRNPCPGTYAGYVIYSKTISQGWGWTPVSGATVLTASDGGGRTDTTIVYSGEYGDAGCNQTTVTIPYPAYSPVYRFTIYFPNNVPTTNYPIVLTGFNP